MIDLHVHSLRSDGTYTPSELVDYAIEKGLSAFALTDHDTVDGLSEAISYAESLRLNGKNAPEVIPGIEFSTEHEGRDIHVVGLFIDYKGEAFSKYLKDFVESRDNRNRKMCEMLVGDGISVPYDDLVNTFPGAVITRAHYAKYMLMHGIVKSLAEAFERYIGDDCKYFIPREKVTPQMAIKLILDANGIPILAHPILYHMSSKKLDSFVGELKAEGLMGIEAVYSTYSQADERQIRKLANKYHLLLSGGSDFHGSNKVGIDLGVGTGKLYVDDEILIKQKAALKNILFTDMDGTLLLNDSSVSDIMVQGIKRMTDAGHRFVFTSGRPLPSILEVKNKFGINFSNIWIIANNGSIIYDCEKEEKIVDIKLSSDILKSVVDICNKYGVHVHSYTDNEIVGLEEDEETKFYRRRIHMPFIKVDDIAAYLRDGASKVQIICLDGKDKLIPVRDEIISNLGSAVNAFFSNEYYLEILPKGVDKGEAIRFLTSYLNVPHAHTFAAGDADNDIPMLKASFKGVAMANASSEVKQASKIITNKTNNENGLLEVIEEYFK